MRDRLPKIIFITGTDGAGKSSMAQFLNEHLIERGYRSCVVWSRFHNYLSKPLLALARLSGHNYYRKVGGIRFGFHDFENIPFFSGLFVLLQAIDVNLSAFFKITRTKGDYDVLICERGPWDTLCDVMADTGMSIRPQGFIGRLFSLQTAGGRVFYIRRSRENILTTRPELVHDYKLPSKKAYYDYLSSECDWCIIDNNRSIELTQTELIGQIFRDPEAS